MRILVTGGTGFLGKKLAVTLLNRGDHVRVLGRNQAICQELAQAGAEVVRGDLRHRDTILMACEDMEAVCHCGALSSPWGPKKDFYQINVEGTRHVLEGCRLAKVNRLVHISSPSVVFSGLDQVEVTEEIPYPSRFASVYSWSKKLAEDLVNQDRHPLQKIILRPKAIFGPGDTSLLPRLVTAARNGRLPQIGSGMNLIDLTYVDNVVHAILLALESDKAVGKTYHITNDEHVPLWSLIERILERLGIQGKLRRVSLPAVLNLATMLEWKAKVLGGEPLLTRYTASILARTQTYNIAAARNDLGYTPRISVEEGVERTLKEMIDLETPGSPV